MISIYSIMTQEYKKYEDGIVIETLEGLIRAPEEYVYLEKIVGRDFYSSPQLFLETGKIERLAKVLEEARIAPSEEVPKLISAVAEKLEKVDALIPYLYEYEDWYPLSKRTILSNRKEYKILYLMSIGDPYPVVDTYTTILEKTRETLVKDGYVRMDRVEEYPHGEGNINLPVYILHRVEKEVIKYKSFLFGIKREKGENKEDLISATKLIKNLKKVLTSEEFTLEEKGVIIRSFIMMGIVEPKALYPKYHPTNPLYAKEFAKKYGDGALWFVVNPRRIGFTIAFGEKEERELLYRYLRE